MVSGRCFVSTNTFERYIPTTPTNEMIIPPSSQTDTMTDVQPSRAWETKSLRATR